MAISDVEDQLAVAATAVRVTEDELIVEFEDGRTLSVPVTWYPRLLAGTPAERQNFEIGAFGIHWPELDEDISFRGLLLGLASNESSASLKFWLDAHRKGKKVTLEDFVKSRKQTNVRKPSRSRAQRSAAWKTA